MSLCSMICVRVPSVMLSERDRRMGFATAQNVLIAVEVAGVVAQPDNRLTTNAVPNIVSRFNLFERIGRFVFLDLNGP